MTSGCMGGEWVGIEVGWEGTSCGGERVGKGVGLDMDWGVREGEECGGCGRLRAEGGGLGTRVGKVTVAGCSWEGEGESDMDTEPTSSLVLNGKTCSSKITWRETKNLLDDKSRHKYPL